MDPSFRWGDEEPPLARPVLRPMAIEPVRWPAASQWRAVLVRTWKEAGDDNVGFLAAGIAFYAFLAFVPLLASVVLVYGLAADPQTVAEHIGKLFATLPRDAAALIADQLKSLTASPKSAKGISLAVAVAFALYGASKGAGGVVTALNIAYELKEDRGFVKTTLLTLAMTVGGLLVILLAVGAISVSALVEHILPFSSPVAHILFQALAWAVAVAAVGVGLAAVYRFAPNRAEAPWMWVSPGSAAATLLWLLGTIGFGLYVSHFGSYNKTYGSLGGVVVFLTWLYLTGYIVLMGGELNSELEKEQAGEATAASPGAAAALPPPVVAKALPAPAPRHEPSKAPLAGVALVAAALGFRVWRRRRKRRGDGTRYGPDRFAPLASEA
jgi:membrane protein